MEMNNTKKYLIFTGTLLAAFLLMELLLRAVTLGSLTGGHGLKGLAILLALDVFLAGLAALLASFFGPRIGKVIVSAVLVLAAVYYSAQEVHFDLFRNFFTAYSLFNGSQATEFGGIILGAIFGNLLVILANFILAGTGIFVLMFFVRQQTSTWGMKLGRQGKERMLRGVNSTILVIALFGTMVTLGGSTMMTVMGDRSTGTPFDHLAESGEIKGLVGSYGLLAGSGIDAVRLAGYGLSDGGDEDTMTAIDAYIAAKPDKTANKKTGLFRDKNLIFITAESFSDLAVSKEYTPTLYRLQKEGFKFANYYNPVWGMATTDGEYINLQGLLPKAGIWSMSESADNALPYTLASQFKARGYTAKAYHNHDIGFYHRDKTHANMGYDFDGQNGGFAFTEQWPESDLEMIEKTTDDFLTPKADGTVEPFHVYYMTASGHMEYNFKNNEVAQIHQDAVDGLSLSDNAKAYVAANIELDQAVEVLLERLEEAGVLENTVIVIAGDHVPYGLTDEERDELRSWELSSGTLEMIRGTMDAEEVEAYFADPYEESRSSLIIWTPGMTPQRVNRVASNLDILPTLSNLFGLDTDEKYVMGRDLFSTKREGIVPFEDRSWVTDTGTRQELLAAGGEENLAYVAQVDQQVLDMFRYSRYILTEDYYRDR